MILVAKMAFWLETPEPYNPTTSSFLGIYHHHHQQHIKLQTNPSPLILSASLVVHNWIWFESQLLWDLKSIWISECRENSTRVVHMEKGTSFILISKLHVRDTSGRLCLPIIMVLVEWQFWGSWTPYHTPWI